MQKRSTKIKPSGVFQKDHSYTLTVLTIHLQGKVVFTEVDGFKI